MESPPSPPRIPLLGHAVSFTRDPLGSMEKWVGDYGPVVQLSFPGQTAVIVADPDLIEQVIEGAPGVFSVGPAREEAFTAMEENAMVVAKGENWKRMRRIMQKYFTPRSVEEHKHTVLREVDRLLEEWARSETLDVFDEMNRLMIRVVASCLLGYDIRGREDPVREAADAVIERSDVTNVLRRVPEWIPIPQTVRYRRARRRVHALIEEILTSKHDSCEGNLLSGLFRAREDGALSDRELRDNVLSFFMAGSDTTAAALSYTVFCLGTNPGEHERLRSVARSLPEKGDGMLESLDGTEGFHHAVEEAMRLYPPAFAVGRMATEECELDGYRIAKGTQMICPQWVVQRDGTIFDDPDSYRPRRWTHRDRWPKYAEFPFGGGDRFCIGSHFAMMEMPIVVARILQQVDFEMVTERIEGFVPAATLRPAHPIEVKVDTTGN